jgi:hypothetical protein
MDEPTARVEVGPDGELVLIDPTAEGVIAAVEHHNFLIAKKNCVRTLEMNSDRIQHFRNRAKELGKTAADVVIVLANVDTQLGEIIADALMPGYNWQEIRNLNQVPFARGLAERGGIQGFLDIADKQAAEKLSSSRFDTVSVVVFDHGVCEVFS